jgi:hypothetical protein
VFQSVIQAGTSFSRARTLLWAPGLIFCSVRNPNQRSTWSIQDDPVGVKCRWNGECRASHALTAGVLWVPVVVADQVDVQLDRDGLVDRGQERAELGRPVFAVQLADHGSVGDVEGGEQAGDAVAVVVVSAALGHTGHHRQHRLGTIQRLGPCASTGSRPSPPPWDRSFAATRKRMIPFVW